MRQGIKVFCTALIAVIIFGSSFGQSDSNLRSSDLNDSTLKVATLTEVEIADFEDKALRKTKALGNYIRIIADKSKSLTQRNNAIEQGVLLFMSENNIVEVSSLYSKQLKRFPVREYLNNLKILPYSKTQIIWYDLFFASNFTKIADGSGRYEAVASIYQLFNGINNEGGGYEDITHKKIKIIIQKKTISTGDKNETDWEVLLGDIKVEETKSVGGKR